MIKMLKMLVVLVIVVRPHTGTLRGLRRRLFSRLVTDPRSGADRGRNTRPEHVRLRSPHGRTWTPGPSKNFRLRRALFTKKHIRFLHLMGAGPTRIYLYARRGSQTPQRAVDASGTRGDPAPTRARPGRDPAARRCRPARVRNSASRARSLRPSARRIGSGRT